MAISWGFSVGNVRAREVSLLKRQDMEQMASFDSEKRLMSYLQDKGYETADSLDEMLSAATVALWNYAKEVAADFRVFDPLLYDNDYHNVKVVLKGILSGKKYDGMFALPGTVDTGIIEAAVKEKKFELLPVYMADAVRNAYDILAHTSDAQLADGVLDKSRMAASVEAAKNSTLISEYVGTKVFYENVKTAIRAAKANKQTDFLNAVMYLENGGRELTEAALSGEKSVIEWLGNQTMYGGAAAAESFAKSPSEFEKFVDDRLMSIARKGKMVTLGSEVLIGYVLARLAEIRAVSMVASGIRTEIGETAIRERLRELYD